MMQKIMATVTGAALGLLIGAPCLAGNPDGDRLMTSFAVLVGFPAQAEAGGGAVALVPGTVIEVGPDELDAPGSRQGTVERSLSFGRAVDKLWQTFRLDPERKNQEGLSIAAAIGQGEVLPALAGTALRIEITLTGFDEDLATFRVVFRQARETIADSTVEVKRRGRAVVGATDGATAPYIFVFIEPDPADAYMTPLRYHEKTGITAPVVQHKVNPVYPEEARRDKVTGTVVCDALIDAAGTVQDLDVLIADDQRLAVAATEAIRQWRFEPARTGSGKAITVRYVLTVKFSLQ